MVSRPFYSFRWRSGVRLLQLGSYFYPAPFPTDKTTHRFHCNSSACPGGDVCPGKDRGIRGHRDTELNNDGTRSVISMENNGTLFPEELSMGSTQKFFDNILAGISLSLLENESAAKFP